MNKILRGTYIAALLIVSIYLFSCKKDNEDPQDNQVTEVQIPDNFLSQIVRQKINLGANEPFTVENLKEVDSLNLRETGVGNLSGMENMTNLVFLDLRGLLVSNLSPISNLHQIKWLSIRETQVNDITPLQGFTELLYLNLNRMDNITDLSPIAQSTKLIELIVRDVRMGNEGITIISNFNNLIRLNIRNSGVSNLNPLAQLMASGALQDNGAELASVDLRDNPIPNEPGLDGYAPIRPYWNSISNRDPNNLPDPVQ
jgi:hypothetical protein